MRLLALRTLFALLLAPARQHVPFSPLPLQPSLDVLHPRHGRLELGALRGRDRGGRGRGEAGLERLELLGALIVEERVGRAELVLIDRP